LKTGIRNKKKKEKVFFFFFTISSASLFFISLPLVISCAPHGILLKYLDADQLGAQSVDALGSVLNVLQDQRKVLHGLVEAGEVPEEEKKK
jgi:hypothetical protein